MWYLTVDFTCISQMVSDTNHWFATWTSPSVSKHLQEPVKNMLHEDSVPFPLGNWWFYRWWGSCAYRLGSESKQPWRNMKDSNPADSGGHAASCEDPPPPLFPHGQCLSLTTVEDWNLILQTKFVVSLTGSCNRHVKTYLLCPTRL